MVKEGLTASVVLRRSNGTASEKFQHIKALGYLTIKVYLQLASVSNGIASMKKIPEDFILVRGQSNEKSRSLRA